MTLLDQAAVDLRGILEGEFSVPVTVTDPAGTAAVIRGLPTDIALTIDPETGVAVTGRNVSVALPIAALTAAGLGVPRGIADSHSKPWLVTFTNPMGVTLTFKVSEALPDQLGSVVLRLEAYHG